MRNTIFEKLVKDMKGKQSFGVFRPTDTFNTQADFSLADSWGGIAQKRQMEDAQQQAQLGQALSSIGGVFAKKPSNEGQLPIDENVKVDTNIKLEEATPIPTREEFEQGELPRIASLPNASKGEPLSDADMIREKIRGIEGKDYSKGGKDYDKKHNVWDILRSVGIGALKGIANAKGGDIASVIGGAIGGAGGGGLAGAFDRNWDNKEQDQAKLARLYAQYDRQYGMEQQKRKDDETSAYNKARTKTILDDDARNDAELKRKQDKDLATAEYWKQKIDNGKIKLANDEELMRLRDKWMTSKDTNDKRRLDLVEKEIEERTERNNANIGSREKIAGISQAGQDRRAQLRIEAQKELANMNNAAAAGRAADAAAARERLAKIKAEVDSLQ